MQRKELTFKKEVLGKVIKGRIDRIEACQILECTDRTLRNYLAKVSKGGLNALKDARHSNNYKLSPKQLLGILAAKENGHWRSARKALEITNISDISTRRVQQIWVEHGLNQLNVERLKPITRFVAKLS